MTQRRRRGGGIATDPVGAERYLIVNADDFGMSQDVTTGIITAHERGVVTSASLMVRRPDAAAAAAYERGSSGLSLGLHLDLGEWEYREGEWLAVDQTVNVDDAGAVASEVDRQVDRFRSLVGRDPTHLDSHQHVHRSQPTRNVVRRVGRRLGVPVRQLSPGITYCGAFYGRTRAGRPLPDAITLDGLIAVLDALPAGWTELGCHPGRAGGYSLYGHERAQELAVLSDPRLRTAILESGIRLRSFDDLALTGAQARP